MHTYLRSVGFKSYSKRALDKLIKTGVEDAVVKDEVVYCKDRKKAFVRIESSPGMGLSIVLDGSDPNEVNVDYCIPYVIPSRHIPINSAYIEKHSYDESYGIMTDDIKVNSTIVSTFENAYEYNPSEFQTSSLENVSIGMSGFCKKGTIILPTYKTMEQKQLIREKAKLRREYQLAAKNGDEEAMESIALEDIDTYNSISRRIMHQDMYSIVDSTFIPCGVECDTYSVLGEIISINEYLNKYTNELVYNMEVECNDMFFNVAVNKEDLLGEPEIGRRFKGHIWLASNVIKP